MRQGYFYRHKNAQDIYIDVLKTFQIKPDVFLVKCRIFGVYGNPYYETTKFRLNRKDKTNWELFTPMVFK